MLFGSMEYLIFPRRLALEQNKDLRDKLSRGSSLDCFEELSLQIKERFEAFANGEKEWIPPVGHVTLPFPPWICQPYVRPTPSFNPHPAKAARKPITPPDSQDDDVYPEHQTKIIKLSKKRLKRMERKPNKNWTLPRPVILLCQLCVNPAVSILKLNILN